MDEVQLIDGRSASDVWVHIFGKWRRGLDELQLDEWSWI
jgi:hypothetical protein